MKYVGVGSLGLLLLCLASPPTVRAACFGGGPDGALQTGETCDDGNNSDADNCLTDCTRPFCGDAHVRTAGNCGGDATKPCTTSAECTSPATCTVEACDDGNLDNCDGCRNDCGGTVTGCGDGFVCGSEQCDPPAASGGGANCSDVCQVAVCGNGVVDTPQEECDAGAASCTSSGASNGQECGTVAGKQACDADGGSCGPGNSDTAADVCRTNCREHRCGDGALDTGEVCDDGLVSGPAGAPAALDDLDTCPNGPTAVSLATACQGSNVCGDGLRLQVDSSARCVGTCSGVVEGCDNGNGTTKTCRSSPTLVCTSDAGCPLSDVCGNSDTRSDACRTSCTPASCGDEVRDTRAGEGCDDGVGVCVSGGPSNGTQCSTGLGAAVCTGDGGSCVDGAGGDAGAACTTAGNCNSDAVANACRSNCRTARCGDGVLDAGEECDAGVSNGVNRNCTDTCRIAMCGDGKRDTETPGVEECDDGNTVDTDNCLNDCTLSTCGDGKLRSTTGNCGGDATRPCTTDSQCSSARCIVEGCDDGNAVSGDGCDANCKPTACGNGIRTTGETCDDGNAVDGDGCDSNCRPTGCGNLVVTTGEQCEDGNTASFDGCSADCCLEPPNAATRDLKFTAMKCLRTALKREIMAIVAIPPLSAARMTRLIDRAAAKEDRAKTPPSCRSLRSAGRRIRSVQYRVDLEAGRNNISVGEHLALGAKILFLTAWYSDVQIADGCL